MKEILHWPESLKTLMRTRVINNLNLGRAVGISHVTIGNYLAGQLPKSEHLMALAKFFGVTTDEMLGLVAPRQVQFQTQGQAIHDAPNKKIVAKLRTQVQNLASQICEINQTLDDLE